MNRTGDHTKHHHHHHHHQHSPKSQHEGSPNSTQALQHHDVHNDRPSTATLNNHKETIAAFEAELKSSRSLLLIQQVESRQAQEHIELLNREVDALRLIVDEKQDEIQRLNVKLQSKKEKVNEFESTFDQFRIDHLAFYELEQQNNQLLERLKEKQKIIDELEIETQYLRNQKDDSMMIDERKVKKLAELEIVMPIERSQLEAKIEQSNLTIAELQSRVFLLEEENNSMKHTMKWNDELKLDQLARSKQAEYQMLMQLDRRDEEQRIIEEEKATLKKTAEIQAQRGNEIQRQWRKSVDKLETVENMCGAIVDYVERDYGRAVTAEKLLRKENEKLQAQTQVLREIVSRASTREGMMELSQSLTSPTKLNQSNTNHSWHNSPPIAENIMSPKQKLLPIDSSKDKQNKKMLSATAPSVLQSKNKVTSVRPQTTMTSQHRDSNNSTLAVTTSFTNDDESKPEEMSFIPSPSPDFINPQHALDADEIKANCIAKYMLLVCTCSRYISEILLMQKDYKILTYGSADAEMNPLDVPPVLSFMREIRLNQFRLVDNNVDYVSILELISCLQCVQSLIMLIFSHCNRSSIGCGLFPASSSMSLICKIML